MLEKIIDLQLKAAGITLKFTLQFVGISKACILFQNPKMEVSCFLVQHRIECWGFLFREKKLPRKLIPEKAIQAGIPPHFFHNLQLGEPYTKENGEIVANEEVTVAHDQGKTYGYSADTLYDESLCDLFSGIDLLYHEATYLHEMIDKAAERYHTTALQAAYIAKKAGVKKLLLGHFSSKYENLDPFLTEAASVFEAVELALEGVTYRI
jgi:ribonuclease Z